MKLQTILFASLLAALPACAGDEAVDEGPTGPVAIDFGTGIDDTYEALQHGEDCKVRFATQGGFWAMYRVRAANVPHQAELDCGLLVGDELVGERTTIMQNSSGGEFAYGAFQVPVLEDDQGRVGTLAGREGEMYCYYNEQLFTTQVVIDVTYPEDTTPLRQVRLHSAPRQHSF